MYGTSTGRKRIRKKIPAFDKENDATGRSADACVKSEHEA